MGGQMLAAAGNASNPRTFLSAIGERSSGFSVKHDLAANAAACCDADSVGERACCGIMGLSTWRSELSYVVSSARAAARNVLTKDLNGLSGCGRRHTAGLGDQKERLEQISARQPAWLDHETEQPLHSQLSYPAGWTFLDTRQILERSAAIENYLSVQPETIADDPSLLLGHTHANHHNIGHKCRQA